MMGKPKDNNFKVEEIETKEIKEYKTLQDIANEYKTNYYTIRKLFLMCENEEKNKPQPKLLKLYNKIKITRI